jgi:hypothetical protein
MLIKGIRCLLMFTIKEIMALQLTGTTTLSLSLSPTGIYISMYDLILFGLAILINKCNLIYDICSHRHGIKQSRNPW